MNDAFVQHILAPVDISDSFMLPLDYVRLFAERFGAKVTLLYAEDLPIPFGTADPLASYEPLTPAEIEELRSSIREYAAKALGDVAFDIAVLPGHPALAISAAVHQHGADLIVMGTHGPRGWRRALAGSVAKSILHSVASPVLVVPKRRAILHEATTAITRVVCPINFSEVARDALKAACRIADAFQAELIAVHVAEGWDEPDMRWLAAHFRHWIPQAAGLRCAFRELVVRGGATERVLDCVEDLQADLIVMGTQQKRFSNETIIGSTSERLIHFSSVPILSVIRGATAAVAPEAEEIMVSMR